MKKIYTLTASALIAISACASVPAERPDTLMSVSGPSHVVITEDASGMTVSITGTEENPDFKASYTETYPDGSVVRTHQSTTMPWYERRRRDGDWTVNVGGLMFGMVTAPGAPESMSVEAAKSYEIGLAEALTAGYSFPGGMHSVMAGIGFTWRNYRTTLGSRYMSDADGTGIIVEPWPDDVKGRFARLKVFSLGFPVFYEYLTPFRIPGWSRMSVKAGVILNWNSHASVKSAWTDAEGRDVTYTSNNVGQRRFTLDFMVSVRPMPIVGVYCKYSPMDVLADGRGPSFKSLSAGLIFCF